MTRLTYQDSGVDVAVQNRFTADIRRLVADGMSSEVLIGPGLSAAAFAPDFADMRQPVLVSSADGVGTKLLLAAQMGRLEGIGIDLVAMCANDCVTVGGRPLFFLDYLAVPSLNAEQGLCIVRGILAGCRKAGCCLVGGETAELPGVYATGGLDLAGVVVGLADAEALVRGDQVRPGDVLIGLASDGVHANGFSLLRRLIAASGCDLTRACEGLDRPLGDVLLTPTRIYVRPVLALLKRVLPTGMVHVTGGGLTGRLARLTGPGAHAQVRRDAIPRQPVFDFLRGRGIAEEEMRTVFNMGVGFVAAVAEADAACAMDTLASEGERAFVFGVVRPGDGGVEWT